MKKIIVILILLILIVLTISFIGCRDNSEIEQLEERITELERELKEVGDQDKTVNGEEKLEESSMENIIEEGVSFNENLNNPLDIDKWVRVIENGFSDKNNTYLTSFVEFKDNLYISTMASEGSSMYSGSKKTGGDIWKTSNGVDWEVLVKDGFENNNNSTIFLYIFKDRLYAVTTNLIEGIEIWVSEDGKIFENVVLNGTDDKDNISTSGSVIINDKLFIFTSNSKSGIKIYSSSDGFNFENIENDFPENKNCRVVYIYNSNSEFLYFNGFYYVGISNPEEGGEIWRTSDGAKWEAVIESGMDNINNTVFIPGIIFNSKLYFLSLNNKSGIEIIRTANGDEWEIIEEDGFDLGEKRNTSGKLFSFEEKLFLITNNSDMRLLTIPPVEQGKPYGFQLWESENGNDWSKVKDEGFGNNNNFEANQILLGEKVYIWTVNYNDGIEIWETYNCNDFDIIFKQKEPSMYVQGSMGIIYYKDDFYFCINDLSNGGEIWRYIIE